AHAELVHLRDHLVDVPVAWPGVRTAVRLRHRRQRRGRESVGFPGPVGVDVHEPDGVCLSVDDPHPGQRYFTRMSLAKIPSSGRGVKSTFLASPISDLCRHRNCAGASSLNTLTRSAMTLARSSESNVPRSFFSRSSNLGLL